jgi:ferredoxin
MQKIYLMIKAANCMGCYAREIACLRVCPTGCIELGGKKSIAAVFEKKL